MKAANGALRPEGLPSMSDECKAAGLPSLAELVRLAPWPKSSLFDMANEHPERFAFVVAQAARVWKSKNRGRKNRGR